MISLSKASVTSVVGGGREAFFRSISVECSKRSGYEVGMRYLPRKQLVIELLDEMIGQEESKGLHTNYIYSVLWHI